MRPLSTSINYQQWLQLDIKELPRWPAPAQWVLCVIIAAILFGLAYWLWLYPIQQQLALQRQTEATLMTNIELAAIAKRQQQSTLSAATNIAANDAAGKNLPTQKRWTETTLMRSLSEWQGNSVMPVDVMQMKPLKTYKQNRRRYLSVQLLLEGDFISLGQYLQNMLVAYPNIRIAGLNINRSNISVGNTLRVNVTIHALTAKPTVGYWDNTRRYSVAEIAENQPLGVGDERVSDQASP